MDGFSPLSSFVMILYTYSKNIWREGVKVLFVRPCQNLEAGDIGAVEEETAGYRKHLTPLPYASPNNNVFEQLFTVRFS